MITVQRIEELASGLDYHLRRLDSFTNDLKAVKSSLEDIKKSQESSYLWELNKVKQELADIKHQLQKYGLPEVSHYESEYRAVQELVRGDDWPQAVNTTSICISDDMAFQRAKAILDLVIGEQVKGRRFLDYGCGQGHVVMEASTREPTVAIGFEIDPSKPKFKHPFFVNNFELVRPSGPFDIVLIYDVLDHLVGINPVAALKQLQEVLTQDSMVYVRTHPWSARHGGHLYEQINKAYLHLTMDEVELMRFQGYSCEHNLKVVTPLETYRQWFKEAGYNILSESPIRQPVDEFFKKASYAKERLLRHWKGDEMAMINAMEIEFVEYHVQPIEFKQQIF